MTNMVLVVEDSTLMVSASRSLRKTRQQQSSTNYAGHHHRPASASSSSGSTVFLSPAAAGTVRPPAHPTLRAAFSESICIRPEVPAGLAGDLSEEGGVSTSTRSTLLYASHRYLQEVQLTLRPLAVTQRSLQLLHCPDGRPLTRQTVHLGGQWVVSGRTSSERDDPDSQPIRSFTTQVTRRGMEKRFRSEICLPRAKLLSSADAALTDLADYIRRQRYHLCERFFLLNVNNNEATVSLSVFRSITADCPPSSARAKRQQLQLQQQKQKQQKPQFLAH